MAKDKYKRNEFDATINDLIKRGKCRVRDGLWDSDSVNPKDNKCFSLKNKLGGSYMVIPGIFDKKDNDMQQQKNGAPGVIVTISSPLYHDSNNIYYDDNRAEMPIVYFSGFCSTMDVRCFAELRELASDIIEASETNRAWAWLIVNVSYCRIESVKFPDGFSEPIKKLLEKFITKASKKIIEQIPASKFSIAISHVDTRTIIYVGPSTAPHFERLNVCCLTSKHTNMNIDNCIDLSDAVVNIYRITTRAANVTIQVKNCGVSKLDVFNAAGMSDSDKRNCVRLLKQAVQKIIGQIGAIESEFEINVRTW